MDLKQISEAYNYLFHPGGASDLTDQENQKEAAVKAQPGRPQTGEVSRSMEPTDLTLAQAEVLIKEVAQKIVAAGLFLTESLYDTSDLKVISPRYV